MTHYFISDLHLSDNRLDLIQAFISLSNILQQKCSKNKECQLHIVGDFYEAWIGDDYQASWNSALEESLIKLSSSGVNIRVYHGNRDFLLGQRWADRVGVTLIKESLCIEHKQQKLLISHGDETCLDDIEYQKFRSMVRQDQWQQHVLSMPLEQRVALAAQLREDSKQSNSDKMLDIMDVDSDEVDRQMQKYSSNIMIHGHTHRPNLHKQKLGERLVLGDWDKTAWLAVLNEKSLTQYKINLDLLNIESLSIDALLEKSNKTQQLIIA